MLLLVLSQEPHNKNQQPRQTHPPTLVMDGGAVTLCVERQVPDRIPSRVSTQKLLSLSLDPTKDLALLLTYRPCGR